MIIVPQKLYDFAMHLNYREAAITQTALMYYLDNINKAEPGYGVDNDCEIGEVKRLVERMLSEYKILIVKPRD